MEGRGSDDRLIIAAEAIFLEPSERDELAYRLSLRAALLLEDATRPACDVATIMRLAYNARSAVAHGGSAPRMKWPDGSEATLDEYVSVVSDYMRDALKGLIASVAAGERSPLDGDYGWYRFTFDRFSS